MDKRTFDELRPKADEAIRAGFTVDEFLTLHDIPRAHWYDVRPKEFKWLKIQKDLGIERKHKTKTTKENRFNSMLPRINDAIEKGMRLKDFLAQEGISSKTWERLRPPSFHWKDIQDKKGIRRIEAKRGPKPNCQNTLQQNKKTSACKFYFDRIVAIAQKLEKAEVGEESGRMIEEINLLHKVILHLHEN